VWIAFLTIMSLQPVRPRGIGSGTAHFILHVTLFGLAAMVPLLLGESGLQQAARALSVVFLAGGVEIGQALIYHKRIEWRDVEFDALGVLIAFVLVRFYRRCGGRRLILR
jgi:hypothetical protein